MDLALNESPTCEECGSAWSTAPAKDVLGQPRMQHWYWGSKKKASHDKRARLQMLEDQVIQVGVWSRLTTKANNTSQQITLVRFLVTSTIQLNMVHDWIQALSLVPVDWSRIVGLAFSFHSLAYLKTQVYMLDRSCRAGDQPVWSQHVSVFL